MHKSLIYWCRKFFLTVSCSCQTIILFAGRARAKKEAAKAKNSVVSTLFCYLEFLNSWKVSQKFMWIYEMISLFYMRFFSKLCVKVLKCFEKFKKKKKIEGSFEGSIICEHGSDLLQMTKWLGLAWCPPGRWGLVLGWWGTCFDKFGFWMEASPYRGERG